MSKGIPFAKLPSADNMLIDRSIVFSSWRLTLDVAEDALRRVGIQTLRFDGKVSQKDRQSVVERFRSDPAVSVMLLTLSCGAVG